MDNLIIADIFCKSNSCRAVCAFVREYGRKKRRGGGADVRLIRGYKVFMDIGVKIWFNIDMKKRDGKSYLGILADVGLTLLFFAVGTGVCFLLNHFEVNDLNFLIIYILGVLLTAVFTKGFIYSALLSVISVLAYNFFFTVPRYTFHFNDPMYWVTFVLMFAVGIGVSALTFQLKRRLSTIHALNLEKVTLKNEAEKEQLKATLLRSISHDLRTPLTTMKNGAELLRDNPNLEAADRDEIIGDIIYKADWTVRLVENLLSLTRIDSENLTVKKTPEALEEILPQAVRSVSGALGGRTIRYDVPEQLFLVPMDATLMIQVIGNILGNAVKYTGDDGNIGIKVWNSGKSAVFRISNDGTPIRAEDMPHIFEAYFTSADSKREGGVGLGLAICKLIITAHGGEISARNAPDGRVVFEFTLPLEQNEG